LAALFLLSSFAAMAVGVGSFVIRGGFGTAPAYERVAIMSSVVLTVIGVKLLEAPLVDANAGSLARIGVTAYLIAGPVLLVAEGIGLRQGERSVYPLIVAYVFLALLAQAALGGALVRSKLVPSSVGWLTLAWNVGFMVFLPIATPQDVYYPLIHGLMPLVIAISILASR
jgi:hypothetical protein